MEIPRAALLLGWAGVIPFAVLSGAKALRVPLPLDPGFALLAYAAIILSFMGGSQWGLTVSGPADGAQSWRRFGASVLPALLAWAAVIAGGRVGFVVLAATFASLLGYDLWTVRTGTAPTWYGRLRVQLTAAVVPLLLVACV